MIRTTLHGTGAHRGRRGFTLLEILIVGALISLFAGIAMFAIQNMYEQNRHKLMYPEAQQIGTALSFAHDDMGIYPRLHLLTESLNTISIRPSADTLLIRPHMDTYGRMNATQRANHVTNNWKGPYAAKSTARLSQGQRPYVKMRLLDVQSVGLRSVFSQQIDQDIALVDWPSDTWSNPWMVYHVIREFVNGEASYRLATPGESPDFLNAVVSYGRNGVPGGTMETMFNDAGYYDFLREGASLFVQGDPEAGYDFTLKSYGASGEFALQNLTSKDLEDSFYYPGTVDPATGAVGMLQEGSDDIVWVF